MPSLRWNHISEIGLKPIYCDAEIPKGAIAYVPGMRTDIAPAYLIQGRVDHVRRFYDAGGDPAKAICHFLTHDDYLLEPLWGPALQRRIEGFARFGVDKIVAPDYSTWGDWPLPVHIHNYYRSNVVAQDFLQMGYHIVAHPNFTHPKLFELSRDMWTGPMPTVLFDCVHSFSGERDAFMRMMIEAFDRFIEPLDTTVALWGRYPEVQSQFASLHKPTFFVPSFVAMRAEYINAVQQRVRQRKKSQEN